MTTNIQNKAREVKAWIERCGPDFQQHYGSRAVNETAVYIRNRWPDLDPAIRLDILNAACR